MIGALVVVAGGRSRRFGDREKALVHVAGRPMVALVVERLASAVERTVINCRADQRPAIADVLPERAVRFAIDPTPDAGPVAGLSTGLSAAADAGADRAVVVGCDMPWLDAATVCALATRLGDADVVVPVAEERRQPFGAVYRVSPTLAACESVGADGRMLAVLDRLDAVEASVPPAPFASVDTPAAVTDASKALAERTWQ
ncbi:molybdenum cofactor guanylyltransferase [Halobaculum gomorrense]|uniref:Probable molybdenum cofactor guanylyltransferase n=1 Tax=Halobaculum gomorrense TaxID=43928 RepID=A0A1M5K6H3_9EURY|nr:molybdenum cofactor guanylyltransferase [Halobaculum gomorrense]SHG47843.1 molybdenum cofactor guanylyltransferase [Halobaculum gomorrense]